MKTNYDQYIKYKKLKDTFNASPYLLEKLDEEHQKKYNTILQSINNYEKTHDWNVYKEDLFNEIKNNPDNAEQIFEIMNPASLKELGVLNYPNNINSDMFKSEIPDSIKATSILGGKTNKEDNTNVKGQIEGKSPSRGVFGDLMKGIKKLFKKEEISKENIPKSANIPSDSVKVPITDGYKIIPDGKNPFEFTQVPVYKIEGITTKGKVPPMDQGEKDFDKWYYDFAKAHNLSFNPADGDFEWGKLYKYLKDNNLSLNFSHDEDTKNLSNSDVDNNPLNQFLKDSSVQRYKVIGSSTYYKIKDLKTGNFINNEKDISNLTQDQQEFISEQKKGIGFNEDTIENADKMDKHNLSLKAWHNKNIGKAIKETILANTTKLGQDVANILTGRGFGDGWDRRNRLKKMAILRKGYSPDSEQYKKITARMNANRQVVGVKSKMLNGEIPFAEGILQLHELGKVTLQDESKIFYGEMEPVIHQTLAHELSPTVAKWSNIAIETGKGLAELILLGDVLKGVEIIGKASGAIEPIVSDTSKLFMIDSAIKQIPEVASGKVKYGDAAIKIASSGALGEMLNMISASSVKQASDMSQKGYSSLISTLTSEAEGALKAGGAALITSDPNASGEELLSGAGTMALFHLTGAKGRYKANAKYFKQQFGKRINQGGGLTFDERLFKEIKENPKGKSIKLKLTKEKIRDMLTGRHELTTPEERDLFRTIGLGRKELKKIYKSKKDINVSVEPKKILTVKDKPYWGKIKSFLNINSESITVEKEGGLTYKIGKDGGLHEVKKEETIPQTLFLTRTGGIIDEKEKTKSQRETAQSQETNLQKASENKETPEQKLKAPSEYFVKLSKAEGYKLEPVEGRVYPIEYEGFHFFAHKTTDGKWRVTHKETGLAVSEEPTGTKEAAIASFQTRIGKISIDKVKEAITRETEKIIPFTKIEGDKPKQPEKTNKKQQNTLKKVKPTPEYFINDGNGKINQLETDIYPFDYKGIKLFAHRVKKGSQYWNVREKTTGLSISPYQGISIDSAIQTVKDRIDEKGVDKVNELIAFSLSKMAGGSKEDVEKPSETIPNGDKSKVINDYINELDKLTEALSNENNPKETMESPSRSTISKEQPPEEKAPMDNLTRKHGNQKQPNFKYVPKDDWKKNLIKTREYAQNLGIDWRGMDSDTIIESIETVINNHSKKLNEAKIKLSNRAKEELGLDDEDLEDFDTIVSSFGKGKYYNVDSFADKAELDKDKYTQVSGVFKKLLEKSINKGKSPQQFMNFLLKNFGNEVMPYWKSFLSDIKGGIIKLEIGAKDENNIKGGPGDKSGVPGGTTTNNGGEVTTHGAKVGEIKNNGKQSGIDKEHGGNSGSDLSHSESNGEKGSNNVGISKRTQGVEEHSTDNSGNPSDSGSGRKPVATDTNDSNHVGINYDLRNKAPVILTKGNRNNINARVKEIIKKDTLGITEEDKEILRQYTGEGGLSSGTVEALNQHYTDYNTIKAIYKAIDEAGVSYNRVLEPAAGSGNFVGMNPDKKWTLIDLDKTNYEVLKRLYPKANIYNISYEDYKDKNFDMVISNVPFLETRGNYKVLPKIKSLHGFYFVHSMDRVKPNGVVAFITSKYIMDSKNPQIREMITAKGDIIGAYRLPQGHFTKNAHTDVTTDIIFIQRRPDGVTSHNLSDNEAFNKVNVEENGLSINEYYKNHPDHILGEMKEGKNKMYGGGPIYVVEGEADLSKIKIHYKKYEIKKGEDHINGKHKDSEYPTNYEEFSKLTPRENEVFKSSSDAEYPYNITIDELGNSFVVYKTIYFTDVESSVKIYRETLKDIGDKLKILSLIDKNATDFQQDGNSASKLTGKKLIKEYKTKYKIHPSKDKELKDFFKKNDEMSLLYDLGSSFDEKFVPREVFERRVKYTHSGIRDVKASDPLGKRAVASENNRGILEVHESGNSLVKYSEVNELLNNGYSLFLKKNGKILLQNDVLYYSGNIYKKRDILKNMMEETTDKFLLDQLTQQIENLDNILPKPKVLGEYEVKGIEPWIRSNKGILEAIFQIKRAKNNNGVFYWEHPILIIKNYLNGNSLITKKNDEADYSYLKRYEAAEQYLEEYYSKLYKKIATHFPRIYSIINDLYNRNMNFYVKPNFYEGKYLIQDVLDEITENSGIKLRRNQVEWVVQAFFEGKGINAQDMGAGKTFAGITLARVLKKRGVAKKPLFVVPAKTIMKWEKETKLLFPHAKVISLGNLLKDKRTNSLLKLANENADYIYISHSGFGKISLSNENTVKYLNDFKNSLINNYKGRNKATAEIKLQGFLDTIKNRNTDKRITLEKLGVDAIFADEAHAFKNIATSSVISGQSQSMGKGFTLKSNGDKLTLDSMRSFDFRVKADYINEMNNNKNIFLFTGTPTPNKPMEMYSMLSHLGKHTLDDYGITSDVDFFNLFFEMGVKKDSPKKKLILKTIRNFQIFQTMRDRFIDYRGLEDMPYIKVPKVKIYRHYIQPSDELLEINQDLIRRTGEIKASERFTKGADTLIGIYAAGRAASVDPRLYGDNHSDPEVEVYDKTGDASDDKIEAAKSFILEAYNNDKNKGQLVFCDFTGKNVSSIRGTIHSEMKEDLVDAGIPRDEIAIIIGGHITDYSKGKEVNATGDKGNQLKEQISELYNEGKIKIVLGNTVSMGEGMNFNKTTEKIHLIDVPYTPGAMYQRIHRGVRQGNENDMVEIHFYIQGSSYDALSYDIVRNKTGWIDAFYSKTLSGNKVDVSASEGTIASPEQMDLALENNPAKRFILKARIKSTDLNRKILEIRKTEKTVDSVKFGITHSIKELNNIIDKHNETIKKTKEKYAFKAIDTFDEYSKKIETNNAKLKAMQNKLALTTDKKEIAKITEGIDKLQEQSEKIESYREKKTKELEEKQTKATIRLEHFIEIDKAKLDDLNKQYTLADERAKEAKELGKKATSELTEHFHKYYIETDDGWIAREPSKEEIAKEKETMDAEMEEYKEPIIRDYANIDKFADIPIEELPKKVALPEIVDFVNTLGIPTGIKHLKRGLLGYMTPKTLSIVLNNELFTDKNMKSEQAAKTLAHELGHVLDWLADIIQKGDPLVAHARSLSGIKNKILLKGSNDKVKLRETLRKRNLMKQRISRWIKRDNEGKHNKHSLESLQKGLEQIESQLVFDSELREELWQLSTTWRPLREGAGKSYISYRKSASELYADFISVLFNYPEYAEKMAPKFYHEFFDWLDKKPVAKEAYFSLMRQLYGEDKNKIFEQRDKKMNEMYDKSEDLQREKVKIKKSKKKSVLFMLQEAFSDKYQAINNLEKKYGTENDPHSVKNLIRQQAFINMEIKTVYKGFQQIRDYLQENGLNDRDLDKALFLYRNMTDRENLAAPKGMQKKFSKDQIEWMKKNFGPEKSQILDKAVKMTQDWWINEIIKPSEDLITPDKMAEFLGKWDLGDVYAPYFVQKYFLEHNITANIMAQVGTLEDIMESIPIMLVKAAMIIRAREFNNVKKTFAENVLVRDPNSEKITLTYIPNKKGDLIMVNPPRRTDHEVMYYKVKGKLHAYYVDKGIYDELYRENPALNVLSSKIFGGINKIFKQLYTTFSPGFQLVNLPRDFDRTWADISFDEKSISKFKLAMQYIKMFKHARNRALGIADPLIDKLEREGYLFYNFFDYLRKPTEAKLLELTSTEGILAGYYVTNVKRKWGVLAPLVWSLEQIRNFGDIVEPLSKLAAWDYLKDEVGEGKIFRNEGELKAFIQNKVGTPNYTIGGQYSGTTNQLLLFSNIALQGAKEAFESATNPKTRKHYAWKLFKEAVFPSVVTFLLSIGAGRILSESLFGKKEDIAKLEMMLKMIPEYDKKNYHCIPIDIINNRVMYLRIPMDETARFIHANTWQILQGINRKDLLHNVAQIFDYTAGQVPSVTPSINIPMQWGKYFSGNQPMDTFRQRPIVSDRAMEAGGSAKLTPMMLWTAGQFGYRVGYTDLHKMKTIEKIFKYTPGIGRFVKFSNYGLQETIRASAKVNKLRKKMAKKGLKENKTIDEFVKQYLDEAHANGLYPDSQVLQEKATSMLRGFGNDPNYEMTRTDAKRLLTRYAKRVIESKDNPYVNVLLRARSNAEKELYLQEMKRIIGQQQFNEVLHLAYYGKIINANIAGKYYKKGTTN